MEKDNTKTPTKEDEISSHGLENLSIQNVYGVNYIHHVKEPELKEIFQQVRKFDMRSDDVLTVGYPRSGNHWAFEMVTMILNQSTEVNTDNFHIRLLEFTRMGDAGISKIQSLESPRILPSHNRMDKIPEQVVSKRVKTIYVLRNPKDTLVSFYKLCKSLSHNEKRFKGTWENYFDLQMRGEFPYGYWFDHVLTTEKFISQHPSVPVHILLYENMKENPVDEIKNLCAFLDKPDSLAEQIACETEFSQMKSKAHRSKNLSEVDEFVLNGLDGLLSKGVTGDWKQWFTIAQNEAFDKLFEEKMAGSKLGDLVKEYIK